MDSSQSLPDDGPSPSEAPLSVLLIEDNPGDARLFEEYLDESSPAFELRHELTLEAGLEALRGETSDVLAVDLGLPDSEGAETVKAIAGTAPKVPIVVLTGQDDLEVALQAQEAGAAEYLQKDELTPALAGRTLRWAAQRSRMQQKLRQRDAWIRSISENIAGGLFRTDPTGRIEYANRALARMLGVEDEAELIGRDLTALYTNSVQQGRMLAEEGADGAEVTFERRDESTFVGLLSAEAVYDAEGRVLHYDGVITDIAEQKQTQRELAQSEALTRSVLDALAANVAVLDGDGTIIEVNAQWEHFGRENEGDPNAIGEGNNYLDACEGPSSGNVVPGPSIRDDLRAVIDGEKDFFEHEYPCHGPEEKRWFLLRATPLGRAEGGAVVAHINVTERVQSARQQRVLSEAVEQAKEAVLITEAEPLEEPGPRIEYVNEAFEEMTGYSEEEVLGQTPRILQGPETEREVIDALRAALEAGEEWEGETINARKGGKPYRVQWNVSPVTNEAGEIEHWVSVQRDVTEERKREKRLARMAQALDQVGDKVAITDREGHIQYVNSAFENMTGYSEEEVLDRTLAMLQSGEHDGPFYEELWDTIQSGETFRSEFVNEKKDGTRYVEDERISPVRNEDGEITHFVSSGRDVTERKGREEELRRRKNLLEQTQRLAGAWEVDLRSGELSWSDEVYRIHEIEPGTEFEVEDGIEFYAPEARPRIREAFERCIEEGEPYDLELPLDTASGNRRWVRTVGAPVVEENGEIVKVAGAFQDITDRKQAEQALREREEYLAVTLQSIGDAVVATDRDGCVVEMNAVAERLTGWQQEEAEGQLLDDILTLHSARTGETVESPAEEVLRDGTTVGLANHTVLTSRDGTEYQIADSAAPIQSEEGDLFGVIMVFRDVTEKYERRRRMERQNDLFSKAQDLAEVGGWEYDVRSGEAIWTEEVYRIHGLPLDADPSPEQSLQFYHEQDRPVIAEAFTRAIENGEPYDLELRLITADGDRRWVRTRGEPQTEDGDVVRLRGTIQDLTDRKRYELDLERATDILRNAGRMADLGGWSVDVSGERPYSAEWTDTLYDLFELSQDEDPPTEDIYEYYHPDDREQHRRAVIRAAEEGADWDQELRLITAEGTERWVRNIGRAITEDGETVEIRGTIQDITERKRRVQTLRNRQQKLRHLYSATDRLIRATDRMEVGSVILDLINNRLGYPGGTVRFAENGTLQPSRVSSGALDLMGERPAFDLEGDSTMSQVYRTGESVVVEDVRELDDSVDYGTTRAGAAFPLGTHGVFGIAAAEAGSIDEFNVHLVEILASHATAVLDFIEQLEDLREAKEEAEKANRLKSAFLANMSHEIRTPLTSILGFAEAIGEEAQGAEEPGAVDLGTLSQFSALIQKSGRRLMETLDLVLNLSRLEAGEMELHLEAVDLSVEAEEIVEQFGPQAEKAGVDLSASVPEDPVWARADAGGVRIVCRNLISNAIKYTEAGGTAEVRVYTEEEGAVLEVEDTGIGMDPSRAQELFEAFKQESEGVAREYEGSGLGLTVTEKVLSEMGGAISVDTEKGEGTRFTVRLPEAEPPSSSSKEH